MDLQEIWKITLAQIEIKLDSPAQFKTWFKDTKLREIRGSHAIIGVKNSYTSDWLSKKHSKLIKDTLSYVHGSDITVAFEIDSSLANKPNPVITPEELTADTPIFGLHQGQDSSTDQILKNSGLNSNYSFANYIVGPSNKLGHAAALAVAKKPGESYNPLFVYGKTGLGKTHLAHAVGRAILESDPYKKVLYVSSEGFLNDMVKAIRSGKNIQFRQKYRTLDLLIIDDIQFIYKWKETQNEFFNTFNVLYNDKKQIILISDRSPDEIQGIEDRLRSRFQGGMTVDIEKPDFEMRLALVESKSKTMGISLPIHINEFIAKNITENVRELEGAIQKVSLYSSMVQEDLSLEEVAKILGKDTSSKREKTKVPAILKCIAKEFNTTVKDLKGPRRTADVAFARQVCMYLLREDYGYKLEQVAAYINRKDHTTVLHAVDKIKSKLMIDEGFKNQIDSLRETISGNDD